MPQRYALCSLGELPPGSRKAFDAGGRRIVCFNIDGRIFAIDDACPHDGAPLSEGSLAGTTLTCPWHEAEFDVTCGKVLCSPAVENVRSHAVTVEGDQVSVEI